MANPKVKQQIKNSGQALKEIMQHNLANIADAMIAQIIGRLKRATPSTRLDCIKEVKTPGAVAYKSLLQTAMAIISGEAIHQARKEVPKAKKIKLADDWSIDDLPPTIRKKILAESELLVGSQIADLEKNIFFQFTSSHDSTDSVDTVRGDLEEAAEDYIRGPGINASSGLVAANYVNDARNAFFYDSDVLEEVEAFQFVNADPQSDICQDLAGTVFAKDDPNADRFQPPLHWNCKSYIVPILKGNMPKGKEIESLKPSKKSLEDSIQFSEKHHMGSCPLCGLV